MRVIFLDVDGVLNSQINYRTDIFPEMADRLGRIITATGAVIVLSSAWRYQIFRGQHSLESFSMFLRERGAHGANVIDTTVADEVLRGRGCQITRWLAEHPEVRSYVILDDVPSFIAIDDWRLVQTDGDFGLTDVDVAEAIEVLRRPLRKPVSG